MDESDRAGGIARQGAPSRDDLRLGRDVTVSTLPDAPDPETTDAVLLTRPRLSRILFVGHLFDYPVSLSVRLLRSLGLGRSLAIAGSYLAAVAGACTATTTWTGR